MASRGFWRVLKGFITAIVFVKNLGACKALIRHTKCVCKCALSLLRGCDKRKKEKIGSRGRVKGQYADRLRSGNP